MYNNPFLHNPVKPDEPLSKKIIDFIQFFVIVIAIAAVSYLFLFIPNQVDGESMYPNFVDGELLFTNKIGHMLLYTDLGKGLDLDYKRGDVVIFQNPGLDPFIKRVIGLPGDEVMIKEGKIYINSRQLIEEYISDDIFTSAYDLGEGATHVVPDKRYLLVGDNRGNSMDSRFSAIGFVHKDFLKGKVFLRYTKCEKEPKRCKLTFDLIKPGDISYQ